jgi:hypothetical protein
MPRQFIHDKASGVELECVQVGPIWRLYDLQANSTEEVETLWNSPLDLQGVQFLRVLTSLPGTYRLVPPDGVEILVRTHHGPVSYHLFGPVGNQAWGCFYNLPDAFRARLAYHAEFPALPAKTVSLIIH